MKDREKGKVFLWSPNPEGSTFHNTTAFGKMIFE